MNRAAMVRLAMLVLSWVLLFTVFANGQTGAPPVLSAVPAQDRATTARTFNVDAAVDAYLAKMPPAERARSDAYFEGGYWLQLWDFLATVFVMWLLLRWRWSTGIRNRAERVTHIRPVQTALYWIQFILVASILTFPLTIYESYFREHKYGLLNQTFDPWMRDQAVEFAVGLVLGAVLIVPLFALVRVLGKSWWVWGAVLTMVFFAFLSLIAPVYIAPLFNQYKTLEDPYVKVPILRLANANGIPATDVYEFDASRQSNRVSVNVGGFAGTQRISLNDNLLKRCTLPEIEMVMSHEMGHYVLNHEYKGLIMYGLVTVVGFAFLNWSINLALARWGNSWDIRGMTDIAVLPLAVIVFSLYSFLMTPVTNTITRTMEYEADMYGLNASGQPDGAANVALMLGEYRKLRPGPVEEFLFFDHPSGHTRITAAMRWKAGHPESELPDEVARPIVFNTQ